MKDAQKPDHVSLTNLIGWLREGRYAIPDFQREFEWEPWDINALLRSIFLDYFIGSLLLWKGKDENYDALACESIYGYEGSVNWNHIVLDGQQRLTAMYYAFVAPNVKAPRRQNRFLFFIRVDKFMEEAFDDAFEYDWTRRGANLLADRCQQFSTHMFPLSVVGEKGFALPSWLMDYEKHWTGLAESAEGTEAQTAQSHAKNAKEFGEYMEEITNQYQVSYIELGQELEIDKVCDIFTQINSRGMRLDVFDLINALVRPKGLQLKSLWRRDAPRLEFVDTDRMNVYVLQVMSLLRQSYCSPKYLYYLLPGQERRRREPDGSFRSEVLVPSADDFRIRWDEAIDSLERAILLLRNPQAFGAVSSKYLPYIAILPAFASLQSEAQALPPAQRLEAQRRIRLWYWASVFTNRYSGSVESTSARDFVDVRRWFGDDNAEPTLISEFRRDFRNLDLKSEVRQGTSVYNGTINLLVLRGAKDWITGNPPQHEVLDDHHIIPKSWGLEHSLGNSIDTILNRTPLASETNRNIINDRLPNTYLRELFAQNGEKPIRDILETHLVSGHACDILLREPFTTEDFTLFIAERQRTIMAAIEDLLIAGPLNIPLNIHKLDADLEAIELELRRTISVCLNGDSSKLPGHVQQRIDERIQSASKKNPAIDTESCDSLSGKLEFADLRELQDTITNRQLWSSFESRFRGKEELCSRFSQLAELRNSIRHSREVSEVTRKDGEAAIAWFQLILELPVA